MKKLLSEIRMIGRSAKLLMKLTPAGQLSMILWSFGGGCV